MSDNDKPRATATNAGSKFSEREQQFLCWTMQSLKSGPPDIDYDKLAEFAGMKNPRSASNAWAKIKPKLFEGTVPGTPSKGGARKKIVDDDGSDNPDGTPKKTPRKRAAKKQDANGEASPTKRNRPGKKPSQGQIKVEDAVEIMFGGFVDREDSASSPVKPDIDAEGQDEDEM